jgi:hypothetical protein
MTNDVQKAPVNSALQIEAEEDSSSDPNFTSQDFLNLRSGICLMAERTQIIILRSDHVFLECQEL